MKNSTIKQQLQHRTIRRFKDEAIPEETIKALLEVTNRTATSTGMQTYSIIRITDKILKKSIADVCGQAYVAEIPELFIFIVDAYRNAEIAHEQNFKSKAECDMDRFFQGFTDGAIAAQNMTVAIESLGLGAIYLGSILNDCEKIIELLNLPKLTFPIVGLGFGVPDEEPSLKPRMDLSMKVFENQYCIKDNYLDLLKDYDKEMEKYCDLRNPSKTLPPFTEQVVQRLKDADPVRSSLTKYIMMQGFNTSI